MPQLLLQSSCFHVSDSLLFRCPTFPFRSSGVKALVSPGDLDVSCGCSELPTRGALWQGWFGEEMMTFGREGEHLQPVKRRAAVSTGEEPKEN